MLTTAAAGTAFLVACSSSGTQQGTSPSSPAAAGQSGTPLLVGTTDKVVPLLQERGVFRSDYSGPALRDHLGVGPLPRL